MPNSITIGLIHALPAASRRGFDRKEAASYIGVSSGTFDKLVRERTMPAPIQLLGRNVWDVRGLDRALDTLSGIDTRAGATPAPVGDEDDLDRELAAFEAKHGHA